MATVEHIMFALIGAAESGESALLAKSVEAVISAREQLMGIRLMSDIPDELIARRIELLVHGESQLHNTEIGREMTAVL